MGEDWYDEGSKAYAELTYDKLEAEFPYEYVFAEWSGDASGKALRPDAEICNTESTIQSPSDGLIVRKQA